MLKRIQLIGIHEGLTSQEKSKIRIFCSAVFVILCISIIYTISSACFKLYIATGLTIFSASSCLFAFFLTAKRKYEFAFHYMMWYGFSFLIGICYLFGLKDNTFLYIIFMPVAASIVFNSKKIIITYFTLSLIILVSVRLLFGEQYIPFYSNEIKGLGDIFAVPNTIFATFLIFMSVRQFKRENLNYQKTVEKQNITLEEKNKEITDSINYAKKIQTALLPSELEFKKNFADSFVLLLPKDIVSGDFYWITEKDNKVFYATADCTGHGVPGGFMTMLGISFLDEIVTEKKHIEVNEILNHLSERIVNTLKQSGNAGENKDGMDIVVCCYNKQTNELSFAAANNSLYLVREKSILEYKADKQPCGFHHDPKPFTKKQIKVQSGDLIVTFTDGFADQFGGDKGKKFKYKQLEELILYSANESLAIQKNSLEKEFINWKGNLEQVDDVLIIAVKIE